MTCDVIGVMETPEFIRAAYEARENETAEQRRKRLASKRAAKYRYFSKVDEDRREANKARQRRWRDALGEQERHAIREQNRLRQQARRARMTSDDKTVRNHQQRARRARLDERALQELREREKMRARRRREAQRRGETDTPQATEAGSRTTMVAPMASIVGPLPPATAMLGAARVARATENATTALRHPVPIAPRPAIEIAPLQFVLPPASMIQSLTIADRMAPLPQVQNVLPHASTLLSAAAPQAPGSSMSVTASSSLGSSASVSTAQPAAPSSLGVSSFMSLLNPSPSSLPLPPPPPITATSTPAMLPSISQLPDLLATSSSARDFFDATPSSTAGFFPSITELTGDFD